MAHFLSGLNHKIANFIELHHYVDLVDMVHMEIKVEKQLKVKTKTNSIPTTTWKSNQKSKGGETIASKGKFEPNKSKDVTTSKTQPKDEKSKGKSCNIQCFRCLGYGHKAA